MRETTLVKKGECLLMEAYIDSNYEGSMSDRRSTAGYYIFLCENLLVWMSKKESVISWSNVREEFRATTLGTCELLCMKNLFYYKSS